MTGAENATGTMKVSVMSVGLPNGATATVSLTGPGGASQRTSTTVFGGTVTFTELPPGAYAVASTIFGFACPSLSVDVQASQTTTATMSCTRTAGTIAGVVASGGAPIRDASVTLTGTGAGGPRTTGADGTFTFAVAPGEYSLTASHHHFTCPVQTVFVELNQTTKADISCNPKSTGTITGTVTIAGEVFNGTLYMSLTGPANRTSATHLSSGYFAFVELPPGTYTVAMAEPYSGVDCPAVSADVQAAQTTTVEISCVFRPPIKREIEGSWRYARVISSQTGSCPLPLRETGTGSMTFHSSNDTIEIVGLDPELTIIGLYDKTSGSYTGAGAAVLSDGSSIQTDVTATFGFDFEGSTVFFTDTTPSSVMTRQHRDPGGNLFCTETYEASGSH